MSEEQNDSRNLKHNAPGFYYVPVDFTAVNVTLYAFLVENIVIPDYSFKREDVIPGIVRYNLHSNEDIVVGSISVYYRAVDVTQVSAHLARDFALSSSEKRTEIGQLLNNIAMWWFDGFLHNLNYGREKADMWRAENGYFHEVTEEEYKQLVKDFKEEISVGISITEQRNEFIFQRAREGASDKAIADEVRNLFSNRPLSPEAVGNLISKRRRSHGDIPER